MQIFLDCCCENVASICWLLNSDLKIKFDKKVLNGKIYILGVLKNDEIFFQYSPKYDII